MLAPRAAHTYNLSPLPSRRRYQHPAPPQKVVIKSERTFDGISLDKPGLDASRTGELS